MLSSYLRQIVYDMFNTHMQITKKRPVKPYEYQQFLNLYEEKIEAVIMHAQQQILVLVNDYLRKP